MEAGILRISLLGLFDARRGDRELLHFDSHKLQQFLAYLLLYRNRRHTRDVLADLLWSDHTTVQARAYLRKAIYQLQEAVSDTSPNQPRLLNVEPEWLQINPNAPYWLDIEVFERAFTRVRDIAGETILPEDAQLLRDAVELYRGDLLNGWYEDWCIYERERLQALYLSMLDKLMGYCEVHQAYEQGLAYGELILSCDRAREQTHRRMMRLRYLAGDRSGALRQYNRCLQALRNELSIEPSEITKSLCEQIRSDDFQESPGPLGRPPYPQISDESFGRLLARLYRIETNLSQFHAEVHQAIHTLESLRNS